MRVGSAMRIGGGGCFFLPACVRWEDDKNARWESELHAPS